MLDVLKSLILDFQQSRPEPGVPRELGLHVLPGKATVLIGVRRCGKSTILLQVMDALERRGVPRENFLAINFFDDRLHGLRGEQLGLVLEAYFSMFPDKKGTETVYCFFDEIQVVSGWEPFVERTLRTEKSEVYLAGSSTQMLSGEVATQMRGRSLAWEVFPMSFPEFLAARGLPVRGALSTRDRLLVQKAFAEYTETGGFPQVCVDPVPPARVRTMVLQEYFHSILARDLIERHDIGQPRALVDLAMRLMENVATTHSANSLHGHLKALGHAVSRERVGDFLAWVEDAFFLFQVPVFDASATRRSVNPRKVYAIDHALAAAVSPGILRNAGHLLENMVFVALRRHFPEIFYHKARSGTEVDFAVPRAGGPLLLVQVCESLADVRTREREVRALEAAMAEHPGAEAFIVTRQESESIDAKAGTIRVMPAWQFLRDFPSAVSPAPFSG